LVPGVLQARDLTFGVHVAALAALCGTTVTAEPTANASAVAETARNQRGRTVVLRPDIAHHLETCSTRKPGLEN
jgi:hypothetical protein